VRADLRLQRRRRAGRQPVPHRRQEAHRPRLHRLGLAHRKPLFTSHVAGLLREGRIRYDETVVTGIEGQFDALLTLLRGGSQVGKLVVDVRGS
jgi:hypothetical protein